MVHERLQYLVDGLKYYLSEEFVDLEVVSVSEDGLTADIALIDEDGDEFYIGSYADPGMLQPYLGVKDLGLPEPVELVCVNGVVFSSLAREIVRWIVSV